ncbi:RNA polymerase sigma factor [Tunicatimonas pelagia]|uniref:RNA polymerase sigma factor n=1 Tax=Tunicatimonas pelagia TaxID=931531 RepID=UPI0026652212|nr:RNA polymerase sigma-70 factor [Tunicatimonas pelagia]WKN41437.1 RNA polymerase sigma-70 factor [Tunicatimonas pelagia]
MPNVAITESLVKRFIQGNPKAFRRIFDTLHAQVYAFSLKITKSPTEAEEVTQQVFIRLWEKRHLVDASRSLEHYLYTITRNCAFNHLKQKANQAHLSNLWVNNSSTVTEDDLALAECQQLTDELINSLPEKRQIIYKMHFEEGYLPAEIATALGISLSTVKSQLTKATKTVKGFLLNYRSASATILLLFF